MPTRRLIAALILGAPLLAAAGPSAAETTKIRFSTIPIIDTAPVQAAIEKGFFKEQGIELDTSTSQGGAAALPALAAGQVDIAFSNIISTVLAEKQGLGFQIVAAGSGTGDAPPDLAGLVAKPDSPIKTGKDLEGKTLAVNTRNNIIWLFARAWVAKTGGNPDKVTYLEVPFPQMIDAVRGGRVDAAFAIEPFLSAGKAANAIRVVGWPYNSTMKRIPVAQMVASKKWIAAHPEIVERFVRGYNKGVDWINANKGSEDWVKLIAGYTRLKPEQVKSIAVPVFDKVVDAGQVEEVIALMRANKLLDGPVDAKALLYKTAVAEVK